jgi:hypothetical protein
MRPLPTNLLFSSSGSRTVRHPCAGIASRPPPQNAPSSARTSVLRSTSRVKRRIHRREAVSQVPARVGVWRPTDLRPSSVYSPPQSPILPRDPEFVPNLPVYPRMVKAWNFKSLRLSLPGLLRPSTLKPFLQVHCLFLLPNPAGN